MWDKLSFANGEKGSENGLIICDEEYKGTCRITLEKCPRYFAITCGIYGAMVHTAFCSEKESVSKYEEMKKELADFIDKETTEDEENDSIITSLLNTNSLFCVSQPMLRLKNLRNWIYKANRNSPPKSVGSFIFKVTSKNSGIFDFVCVIMCSHKNKKERTNYD